MMKKMLRSKIVKIACCILMRISQKMLNARCKDEIYYRLYNLNPSRAICFVRIISFRCSLTLKTYIPLRAENFFNFLHSLLSIKHILSFMKMISCLKNTSEKNTQEMGERWKVVKVCLDNLLMLIHLKGNQAGS